MIVRNEYQGDLALGKRIKTTVVAGLDTVTEGTQTLADTMTTARSFVELVHGSLQPAIAEQRIEYADTIHKGIKSLVAQGMDEEQACKYLQVPYVVRKSNLANVPTS